MKTSILLPLCLLGACSLANAQPPTGSRALTRAEMKQVSWPRFARLDHGDYVAEYAALQFLLRNQGFYKGQPDGTFDSMRTHPTERAVKAFQRAKGLTVDGVVGAQTWQKLCVRLKRGDRGDAVRALQTLLNTIEGHEGEPSYGKTKVDGIFGASTDRALKQFQTDSQLVVDGVVGPQMWSLLLTFEGDHQ